MTNTSAGTRAGRPGPRNLITDVEGLLVGNADDAPIKSGVTAVLCEEPAAAAVQVLGGAPGTRETDLLEPHNTVGTVDAIVLSGGSAFGLDAASGAQAALVGMGRGFAVREHRIPIVPSAILFDLLNGGDKSWGERPPYRDLGHAAITSAAAGFEIGSHGAGAGATTANLKGGLGSASLVTEPHAITVGALVAANPVGAVTVGATRHFWAAPFELDGEFGGLGLPSPLPEDTADLRIKFREHNCGRAAETPPSPSSPRTRNSPRQSASGWRSPPMTDSPAQYGRRTPQSTATWSSRSPPAGARSRAGSTHSSTCAPPPPAR